MYTNSCVKEFCSALKKIMFLQNSFIYIHFYNLFLIRLYILQRYWLKLLLIWMVYFYYSQKCNHNHII